MNSWGLKLLSQTKRGREKPEGTLTARTDTVTVNLVFRIFYRDLLCQQSHGSL